MCSLFHGVPGGISDMPVVPSQNCCSASEMNSGSLSIRSTFGGPASGGEHHLEVLDKPVGGDRPFDDVQQRAPGVFDDHRGDLDCLAVDSGVELELDCPQDIRASASIVGIEDTARLRGQGLRNKCYAFLL